MILWIRSHSLAQLERQRSLDRCLYAGLDTRCSALSRISNANKTLRRMIHAMALVKAGKAASLAVPGMSGVFLLSEATEHTAQAIANAIARYQDLQILLEKAAFLRALNCGIPLPFSDPLLHFERTENWEASLAGAPAPLRWLNAIDAGELRVRSRDLRTESYGHCETPGPRTSPNSETNALSGETYTISFAPVQRGRDRSPLKSYFSSPSRWASRSFF
ncbi:MAG: hypothetical protein HYW49_09515 [Deltaproteobacteria bacterium]|nr:hypothetical protein [Deltaproteobacteria bacterium]